VKQASARRGFGRDPIHPVRSFLSNFTNLTGFKKREIALSASQAGEFEDR